MNDSTNKTAFWAYIGEGVCVLFLSLGIGGCQYLSTKNDTDIKIEQMKVEQLKLELKLKE